MLTESEVNKLMKRAKETEGYQLTIDLELKQVYDEKGFSAAFEIDEFRRRCLLDGLDDIGLTLRHEDQITAYEQQRQP